MSSVSSDLFLTSSYIFCLYLQNQIGPENTISHTKPSCTQSESIQKNAKQKRKMQEGTNSTFKKLHSVLIESSYDEEMMKVYHNK